MKKQRMHRQRDRRKQFATSPAAFGYEAAKLDGYYTLTSNLLEEDGNPVIECFDLNARGVDSIAVYNSLEQHLAQRRQRIIFKILFYET